jgi:hypothetical protein
MRRNDQTSDDGRNTESDANQYEDKYREIAFQHDPPHKRFNSDYSHPHRMAPPGADDETRTHTTEVTTPSR